MDLLLLNLSWMAFNIVLAVIPVAAGLVFYRAKTLVGKIISGTIWLVFLPNTLYLLTDLFHLIDDWRKLSLVLDLLLIPFYLLLTIIGVLTFVFSLYPIEQLLIKKNYNTHTRFVVMFGINILVGIGITLGRIERINSWEAITNIGKTVHAIFAVFSSFELLLITAIFAVASNILYVTVGQEKNLQILYRKLRKGKN